MQNNEEGADREEVTADWCRNNNLLNMEKKQGFSACVVFLSARDLISLLCVTVWSTGPGSNWPRVM